MKQRNYYDVIEADFRTMPHSPFNRLKDCAMAVAFGIGIGVGVMIFWYEKPFLPKIIQRREIAQEESFLTSYGWLTLTKKQQYMLEQGSREIARKTGWHYAGVWNNWCEILARQGEPVMDANVRKVIDDTLNPVTPMGKLMNKYRGPKVAPFPSPNDEQQVEELYSRYELYHRSIDALMDENNDGDVTREERNRAIYKLLQQ